MLKKSKYKILGTIFLYVFLHQSSQADALSEAYDAGYAAGYKAGLGDGGGGGGGSKGLELGFTVVPKGNAGTGGSTSGHEVPWAAKFNNQTDFATIVEMNDAMAVTQRAQNKSNLSNLLRAAKAKSGTVLIEGVPGEQLMNLGEQLKGYNIQNYWVAPSVGQ